MVEKSYPKKESPLMNKLVILRHGESLWNLENKFTGWIDIDLSKNGKKEASSAGKLLKKEGFDFDLAYTSLLKRANNTLEICMKNMDIEKSKKLKIIKNWRLNERHYGALQGLNKKKTSEKYGQEQVLKWRRSFDIQPPASKKTINDSELSFEISKKHIPLSESLRDVINRFKPYWKNEILKKLKAGKKILIVAHGNSLRALLMIIKNISKENIVNLNIPTGIPLVIEMDKNQQPIRDYYLGSKDSIAKKIHSVASQGSINT